MQPASSALRPTRQFPRGGIVLFGLLWALPAPMARAATAVIQAPVARLIERATSDPARGGAPLGGGTAADAASGTSSPFDPVVGTDGRITLWLTMDETSVGVDPTWESGIVDCTVVGTLGSSVQVRIPPARVIELARVPGVRHIGLPPRPLPLARSEGLDGMRAPEFWSRFGRGAGARIGVIDVGFAGYDRLLGSELPRKVTARSFYVDGGGADITGGGETHGTACAELVHDVAPEAELYLANAGTPAEMSQAVDWMIDEGVEVISHSIGWPFGGGDGRGPIHGLVERARQNGVLWVNAAGNFADGHWGGPWSDEDNDRILDVDAAKSEAIRLPSIGEGTDLVVWLLWDRWPQHQGVTFEVDLISADGRTLASSQYDWADYPYAFRPLFWQANATYEGLYLRVRTTGGEADGRFVRVIRTDGELAPASQIPEGSLAMPADAPDAIAVGAFGWSSGSLEVFSSRGPTLTGLAKPELVGPDRVTTEALHAFWGTSAACPHVAGAIGLILSAGVRGGLFDGRWSRDEVLAFLRRNAEPLGGATPPGAEGWGAVRLPLEREEDGGPRLIVTGYGDPDGPVLTLLRAGGAVEPVRLFDLQGRLLGRIFPEPTGDGRILYRPGRAELRLARGRYWAMEPASGARASFVWPRGTTP